MGDEAATTDRATPQQLREEGGGRGGGSGSKVTPAAAVEVLQWEARPEEVGPP
jgi:hypothetical protein